MPQQIKQRMAVQQQLILVGSALFILAGSPTNRCSPKRKEPTVFRQGKSANVHPIRSLGGRTSPRWCLPVWCGFTPATSPICHPTLSKQRQPALAQGRNRSRGSSHCSCPVSVLPYSTAAPSLFESQHFSLQTYFSFDCDECRSFSVNVSATQSPI